MCDTRTLELARLARQGADTEHELRKAVAELRQLNWKSKIEAARKDLEERGDLGALRFLERVVEELERKPEAYSDEWMDENWGPSPFLKGEV